MQTSTRPALFLICGHGIHEDCLNEYLKVGVTIHYHSDKLRVSDLHEIHHRHDILLPVPRSVGEGQSDAGGVPGVDANDVL